MFPTETPIHSRLIATAFGPFVEGDLDERVVDLLDGVEDRSSAEQCQMAMQVLAIQPENIEALTVLGHHAEAEDERLAILVWATRIGAKVWKPALEGAIDVDWWSHHGTRPFMRALCCYGMALAGAGRVEAAERCFIALIRMDPNDALGAKHLLRELEANQPLAF